MTIIAHHLPTIYLSPFWLIAHFVFSQPLIHPANPPSPSSRALSSFCAFPPPPPSFQQLSLSSRSVFRVRSCRPSSSFPVSPFDPQPAHSPLSKGLGESAAKEMMGKGPPIIAPLSFFMFVGPLPAKCALLATTMTGEGGKRKDQIDEKTSLVVDSNAAPTGQLLILSLHIAFCPTGPVALSSVLLLLDGLVVPFSTPSTKERQRKAINVVGGRDGLVCVLFASGQAPNDGMRRKGRIGESGNEKGKREWMLQFWGIFI